VSLRRARALPGPLLVTVAAGLIARIAVVAVYPDPHTYSAGFDLAGFERAAAGLRAWGLDVYGHINAAGSRAPTYPYPPGYLPWAALMSWIGGFGVTARILPILADVGIATLLVAHFARLGASARRMSVVAATIMLNPVMIATSAHYGQLDSLAILPALAGVMYWDAGRPRRATVAGLLIGVGAAIKTVPLVLTLALLPGAADRREGARAALVAVALLTAVLTPFLLADGGAVLDALGYHGIEGQAGLSTVVQPGLVPWTGVQRSELVRTLDSINFLLVGLGLAATMSWALRVRPAAMTTAVALWLVVYLTGVHWLVQYTVWVVPFAVLTGRIRFAVAISAIASVYVWDMGAVVWHRLGLPETLPQEVWVAAAAALLALWASTLWMVVRSPPPRVVER
jgi:uncharacterized membrane protein